MVAEVHASRMGQMDQMEGRVQYRLGSVLYLVLLSGRRDGDDLFRQEARKSFDNDQEISLAKRILGLRRSQS